MCKEIVSTNSAQKLRRSGSKPSMKLASQLSNIGNNNVNVLVN